MSLPGVLSHESSRAVVEFRAYRIERPAAVSRLFDIPAFRGLSPPGHGFCPHARTGVASDRTRREPGLVRSSAFKRESFLKGREMRGKASFRLIIMLLIGLLMVGCGRRLVGQPINEENVPKIAVGKTTREEILRLFGTPYQIEVMGDQQVLTYLYGTTSTWTVILYTETQDNADILTIFIDQKGVVSDYVFSKGVSSPDIYRRPGVQGR